MSTRTRKQVLQYRRELNNRNKTDALCVFCNIVFGDERVLQETKSFYVIKNIYGYTLWDSQNVDDHLMIIPKKHTDTISDLTAPEAIEFVDLLGSYELHGYSIWARSPRSNLKSVIHQHTHLIKTDDQIKKFILHLKKPYLLLTK